MELQYIEEIRFSFGSSVVNHLLNLQNDISFFGAFLAVRYIKWKICPDEDKIEKMGIVVLFSKPVSEEVQQRIERLVDAVLRHCLRD